MKLFTVTKRQVLKAIRTEPLKSGQWFFYDDETETDYDDQGNETKIDNRSFKNNTKCAVCAVGSILDCSIGTKDNAEELNGLAFNMVMSATFHDIDFDSSKYFRISEDFESDNATVTQIVKESTKMAKKKKFLSALSSLFEGIMSKNGMKTKKGLANKKARRILESFVKKNFPSTLKIDTDRKY